MTDSVVDAAAGSPPGAHQVLGVVGWSGSGKTTLIEKLLPILAARGLRVSVVKHSHHDIVLDAPGKDSDRHRKAGAHEVMVVSPLRWGLFAETAKPPTLAQQLARLAPCDLVLVEGQKQLPIAKLEVFRPETGHAPQFAQDPHIIAVVSTAAAPVHMALPWLPLDDADAVADWLQQWLAPAPAPTPAPAKGKNFTP